MLQKNLRWIDVVDDQAFFSQYVAMNSHVGLCVDCRTFHQIVQAKKDELSQQNVSLDEFHIPADIFGDGLSPPVIKVKDVAQSQPQYCFKKAYAQKAAQPIHLKSDPKIQNTCQLLPCLVILVNFSQYIQT